MLTRNYNIVFTNVLFVALSYTHNYYWFLICSLLGGISIGSLFTCQDLTLCDVLGNQFANRSHKLFSTLVGLGVLTFCFVHSTYFYVTLRFIFLCIFFCFTSDFTKIDFRFLRFDTQRANRGATIIRENDSDFGFFANFGI